MVEYTKDELRDLTIAFIVLIFCFAFATSGFNLQGFISCLPIIIVGVAIGSVLHELGHKFVAMKYGCRSEFKLWPLGLLIAVASSFFGVVFATPGTVHTYADNLTDEIDGKIAIAGPMANMVLALVFIAIAAVMYPLKVYSVVFELIFLICAIGFSVNSFLAAFNLFPIYSLDGTKVLKWNMGIWILVMAIAGVMVLISIAIGAENMVQLIMGV
ncbi:site-2 protease family protein [Methanobrevibacter sp.]|uniref:site-2 protease family protein n=1 Tax=Methanobrevibacter sp. TaxID=66852 RepID=UPI00386CA5B2